MPRSLEGGCLCGAVRYRVGEEPLTLYACHCTDCQTASGASFTLAMVVPARSIHTLEGEPRPYERPRADGRTKDIFRCPRCLTALWGVRPDRVEVATVYAGTLSDTSSLDPVGHIWTRSAQPWVRIPEGVLHYAEQPPSLVPFVQAWQARAGVGSATSSRGVPMGVQISALHVRRSSLVRATPERVWQEFTSFERLAAWFGLGHRLEVYEPGLGGRILLSVSIEGEKRSFGGAILVFEAARELTFSNQWETGGWSVPTLLTLRLTPLFDACHVELFHHGFERLGADAASELEGYESGWHSRHLEALKAIVEA